MIKKEITGIILSGGKGSRMGEEKGLVQFNGKPLICHSIETIQNFCDRIIISANSQTEKYSAIGYQVIKDRLKGIGPIGGLLSCLEQSDTRYNFVISCDTPFIPRELYPYLLESIENFQVAVPVHKNYYEPLCAVYATNTIWHLQHYIDQRNYKLTDFLKSVNAKTVTIHDQLPFYHEEMFANMNTLMDIQNNSLND